METRASYLFVGAFTLLIVAGVLAFVLWMGRDNQGAADKYVINFSDSVAGLSVGNDVVFNGVRVGQVAHITLSPLDPSAVRVLIQVGADTPVRKNSTASLEVRGITGLSVVSITGGTADSPLLKAGPDDVPEIPSRASNIQAIMATVPEVMTNLNTLIERANAMLSPENAKALNTLLTSLSDIMETAADGRDSVVNTIAAIDRAATEVADLAESVNSLSESAKNLVNGSVATAVESFAKAVASAQRLLSAIEPSVQRLGREAAEELQTLLADARNLLTKLSNLASLIESDPRRFFFGNTVPEYSVP